MSDIDAITVLRQLPPDTTAEQATNLLGAIREASATGQHGVDDPVEQQPARPLTPAQADEAERQALGQQMLEKLQRDCPDSFR